MRHTILYNSKSTIIVRYISDLVNRNSEYLGELEAGQIFSAIQ